MVNYVHPLCKGGQNSRDENFGGFLSFVHSYLKFIRICLLIRRQGGEIRFPFEKQFISSSISGPCELFLKLRLIKFRLNYFSELIIFHSVIYDKAMNFVYELVRVTPRIYK